MTKRKENNLTKSPIPSLAKDDDTMAAEDEAEVFVTEIARDSILDP